MIGKLARGPWLFVNADTFRVWRGPGLYKSGAVTALSGSSDYFSPPSRVLYEGQWGGGFSLRGDWARKGPLEDFDARHL